MLATVFNKQWPEISGRIWTYPVVVLTFVIFGAEPRSLFFVLVCGYLAIDMAIQTAGDDVRWRSYEFILTRAIDRRKYFSARFLFGLLPVIVVILFYLFLEACDFNAIFWNIISEPLPDPSRVTAFEGHNLFLLPFSLLFLYAAVSFLCSGSTRESTFMGFAILGVVVTIVYYYFSRWVCEYISIGHAGADSHPPAGVILLVFGALHLVPALAFSLISRERYARRELPDDVRNVETSSNWAFWLILVLLLVVAMLFLVGRLSSV